MKMLNFFEILPRTNRAVAPFLLARIAPARRPTTRSHRRTSSFNNRTWRGEFSRIRRDVTNVACVHPRARAFTVAYAIDYRAPSCSGVEMLLDDSSRRTSAVVDERTRFVRVSLK